MTSTLTLYYNSVLLPDKNMALDNAGSGKGIGLYLSTLTSKAITGFQYVKHGLSISIRLDESQTSLAMGSGAEDLNYCKIQNGTQNPIYYFIVGKKWKSMETIELSLQMDTLNSFEYNVDYPLRAKTLVYREHQQRLQWLGGYESYEEDKVYGGSSFEYFYSDLLTKAVSSEGEIDTQYCYGLGLNITTKFWGIGPNGEHGIWIEGTHTPGESIHFKIVYSMDIAERIIHKPSEDIQAPKRKIDEESLYDSYQYSWSLLYRNRDIPDDHNQYENPVDCYLIPETPLKITVPTATGVIDSSRLDSGEYMIFFAQYDPATIQFNGTQYTPTEAVTTTYGVSSRSEVAYALHNNSGTFELYVGSFYDVQGGGYGNYRGGQWTKIDTASDTITILNLSTIHVRKTNSLPDANAIFGNKLYLRENATDTVSLTSEGTQIVMAVNTIDKTDPRNIKLIRLPYAPCEIEVDSSGIVTLSPSWEFDSDANLIKLADNNLRFVHPVKPKTDKSILYQMYADLGGCTIETTRNKYFESKLLHSDYYVPKFVYDSFSKDFHLERIDAYFLTIAGLLTGDFEFTFVMTRNIVSKFLFDFTQYVRPWTEEEQDYNHVLCVARNNEEVLYNSQYLNYLRTGYNYDLKTKERTEAAAGIGIGLNIAGLVASLGLSLVPGGQAIGIGTAVASGIGLVSQLVNYAKTTAQNDQNIAQKLQESQMQAVSVQNADDVDLLDYYSNNKAKLCYYKVSAEMEDALFDLFHYCGYKTNLQKVPDKSTRYWFNFVQADLVFVDTANLPSEVEEDIKAKFNDGVTFFHYREGYGFDFAQEKENWETAIVPYLDEPEE